MDENGFDGSADFDAQQETADILSDHDLMLSLQKATADLKAGEVFTSTQVLEAMNASNRAPKTASN